VVTVDNKIDTFAQIVMDKLNAAYEEKKAELDAQNELALKAYEGVAKDKADQYIASFEAEGRVEAKKLISKARTAVRNKHIETRQEIYKNLDKALKERIHAFTNESGYVQYLEKSVRKAIKEIKRYDGIVIEITPSDLEKQKSVIDEVLKQEGIDLQTVNYQPVEKGMMGGVIFYNQEHVTRMDYSLDALLEENSRVLGILLSDIFDEVGE
jgi:vacuolar-type H+-ATPase subunit E/Vma4